MTITSDTITTDQIKALRSEALSAGDTVMYGWCWLALASREKCNSEGEPLLDPETGETTTRTKARAICADVINAAAAMVGT